MKRHLIFAAISLLLCACASTPTNQDFTKDVLSATGASILPQAKKYAFEEFYKTSALSSFRFSPDKKTIYFKKSDGKVQNVFQYVIATQKTSQVTSYPEQVTALVADPKIERLYIMKDIGGSELYDVFMLDLKTKKTINLSNNPKDERSYLCDVTDDGSKLYFSQSRNKRAEMDIKVIDLKTFKVSEVLHGNKQILSCEGLNLTDDKIAFSEFVDNNEIHIGILDLKSGEKQTVNADPAIKNGAAGFDPSDNLYFTSTKGSDKSLLWRYDSKTKKSALYDWGKQNNITGASVLAHGTASAVAYRDAFKTKFEIYSGVFQSPMKLPLFEGEVKNVNFARTDSSVAVVTISPGSAPEQYYLLSNDSLTKIFDSNQSTIKENEFAKPYSTYVKSFDGTQVPTHFFIPPGTNENSKLPVIFWIHGGPEDNVDPDFEERIQYLANQGFVVVAPNVRGSTGFGKKYQFMDNGDWGGAHIKDIVSVAELTKSLRFVDASRVYVLGGSFGGFSVMSLITQYPKVFRAAVDIFGPIEMKTFVESWPSSIVPYWLSELGKDPRKDDEFNKKVSPIYHIQNIEIPLEVHQGENDIRVPKSQSDLLVEKLKVLGKPVEYHIYQGEGHGFTKFENSRKCFTRIVEFFSKN